MAGRLGFGDEQLSLTSRVPGSPALRWAGWLPAVFLLLVFFLPLVAVGQAVGTVAARGGGSDLWLAATTTAPLLVAAAVQAGLSAALTLAIGLPLTHLAVRREFTGRKLLVALMTLPFLLPTVVTGLALRELLGGVVPAGLPLVLAGHVFVNLAVVLRLVGPVWAELDERLGVVAASLGAGTFTSFRTVTWPLLLPAVRRAAAVVFVYCFSSLGLVLILGGGSVRTLETQLLRQVSLLLDFPAAALTAFTQLLVIGAVLGWSSRRPLATGALRRTARRRLAWPWAAWLAAALLAAPLVGIAIRSIAGAEGITLEWWRRLLTVETSANVGDVRAALATSLLLAGATAAIASLLGLAVAVTGLQGGRWRWLQSAVNLPLAVSSVTLGLGLLLLYGRPPFNLQGGWWLLPLAHALLALPLVAAVLGPAVQAVDRRLEVLAATLGASPLRAFATAYGPLLRRLAGQAAALSAAVSLGEFGAASFLTAPDRPTVPVQIMRLLERPGAESLGVAAAASVLLAAAAVGLVLALDRSAGRSR